MDGEEQKIMVRIRLLIPEARAETTMECTTATNIHVLLKSIADRYGPKVKNFFFGSTRGTLPTTLQVAVQREGRIGSQRLNLSGDVHTGFQDRDEILIYSVAGGG